MVLYCDKNSEELLLTVCDNGSGMTQIQITKACDLFDQFSSGNAREKEELGLGLPLSNKLVELLGGTLNINSIIGIGTEINISIPFISAHC